MSSMSHCVIENTCDDMWSSVHKFNTRFNDIKNNEYEFSHICSLYEACKQYVELYEKYLEDKTAFLREHSPEEWVCEVHLKGNIMYEGGSWDKKEDAQDEASEWIQEYINEHDTNEISKDDFTVRIYNINDIN